MSERQVMGLGGCPWSDRPQILDGLLTYARQNDPRLRPVMVLPLTA